MNHIRRSHCTSLDVALIFFYKTTKTFFRSPRKFHNNVFLMKVIEKYDYFFSENGLVAYKGGKLSISY